MWTTEARDAQTAYLFQCRNDSGLFAVSLQRNAGNIPSSTAWYGGWSLQRELTLRPDAQAPSGLDPKPILRGLRSFGYYVWRNGVSTTGARS
jgi:hypothetical protein